MDQRLRFDTNLYNADRPELGGHVHVFALPSFEDEHPIVSVRFGGEDGAEEQARELGRELVLALVSPSMSYRAKVLAMLRGL